MRKQEHQDFKAIVSCRVSFGTTHGSMRPCLNRTQYDRSGELSPWFRTGMAWAGDPSYPSWVASIHIGCQEPCHHGWPYSPRCLSNSGIASLYQLRFSVWALGIKVRLMLTQKLFYPLSHRSKIFPDRRLPETSLKFKLTPRHVS